MKEIKHALPAHFEFERRHKLKLKALCGTIGQTDASKIEHLDKNIYHSNETLMYKIELF